MEFFYIIFINSGSSLFPKQFCEFHIEVGIRLLKPILKIVLIGRAKNSTGVQILMVFQLNIFQGYIIPDLMVSKETCFV